MGITYDLLFFLFITLNNYGRVAGKIEHDFRGFDDSILFGLAWPGRDMQSIEGPVETWTGEVMRVTTANKEQYECRIPQLKSQENKNIEDYVGPSPIQLLSPLFSQKFCSYRLETYWSYELCHGRYLRQYHEERDGKKIKIQEYYLGRWSKEKQDHTEQLLATAIDTGEKPKQTKIDGVNLPYLEIVMDDGTTCDLSGKPRRARIQYVCYQHGTHEVYSFKETSTCEYEVLILSPLLCAHPRYKPHEAGENTINCLPVGDALKKPRSLLAMEAESLKQRHQTVYLLRDKDPKDVFAVLKVEKFNKDGETRFKFEIHPLEEEAKDRVEPANEGTGADSKAVSYIADTSPVRAFLNGESCLVGGTGWWKYEFCYGRSVKQFHVDRNGARSSVLLGEFHEAAHKEWIRENPHKAPKPPGLHRTSLSHFYSGGEICDQTGKPRQTEVKLKCLENASSTSQVSLYLLEPRTCMYILGVESPLICDILPLADSNGLVKISPPVEQTVDEKSDNVEDKETMSELNFLLNG